MPKEKKKKKTKITKKVKNIEKMLPSLEEMLKAGVHFGHRTSKWNAKMEPYIFTTRNNVHIIDLEKTEEKLKEALEFLQKIKEKKGTVIFVGTKISAKEITQQSAQEVKMPYVIERWIGGTLTNFKVISKRLEYIRDLEKKRETGELKKYTKKEQHEFNIELQKMNKQFGGIKEMTKLPDALLVIDTHKEKLAVKEAKMKEIPVVGLCDTNADPTIIDYPIPANDDAISSLKLILGAIVKALK
jgi:small subunit ribosomal protein S2